jgi:hypothetical protein
MTKLKVTSTAQMGPLEVSVYGPEGEAFEFVLSSGATERNLDVPRGRYAVVARRPNGARLTESVVVKTQGATVNLASLVGSSPNEFMKTETMRGSVTRDKAASPEGPWRSRLGGIAETVLRGAVAHTARQIAPDILPEPIGNMAGAAADVLWQRAQPASWTLRLWVLGKRGWTEAPEGAESSFAHRADISSEFLKVIVQPRRKPLAIGMVNENGFGPIVSLPPFAEDIQLSFLSRSLSTGATDRTHSVGGLRVPVAILSLHNLAAQDLMAALAEPATPPAEALWSQSSDRLYEYSGPWEMLIDKFERPAEALLAAHYLLRFLPGRLPVKWADNLCRAMPSAMDGPVIAAWARLHNRPEGLSDNEFDKEFKCRIEMALKRPVTLFARSRALLFDALQLIKDPGLLVDRTHEVDYRKYGAEAGGLESFWGGGPASPGKSVPAIGGTVLAQVKLVNGAFDGLPVGPGRDLPLRPLSA